MKRSRTVALAALSIGTLTLLMSEVRAQSINELIGDWVTIGGPQSGGRLEIRRNFDTQDSSYGQGRIVPTGEWAANYVIVYRNNQKCFFYISLSGFNQT